MSVNVDLTRRQMNKLKKGENVRLKPEQLGCGLNMLNLDNKKMTKMRRAMTHGKGLQISPNELYSVDGEGLKDVLKSVKKVAKKTIKIAKPIAKDVYKFTKKEVLPALKPIAKSLGREMVKTNREFIDKGLKGIRERGEQEIEDILTPYIGKELAQDIVTTNSAVLSKKASDELDKLEKGVDKVMTHPEIGMQKGRDYAYLNPYNVSPEGLNELPVAVAQAIPVAKGEGVHRMVYIKNIKGGSAKKFFKKVGRFFGKVVKSPQVKQILGNLVKQGVASMVTSMSGNPMLGQAVADSTASLQQAGVDALANTTGKAMGAGMLVSNKTVLKNSGGALFPPMGKGVGGALYPPGPMYKGRGRPRGRGLNSSDVMTKQQGGKYYV